MFRNLTALLVLQFSIFVASFVPALAEVERFPARDGAAIELWRITNDPAVRDHANYHNTQCWSPDGRYLCYTHYADNGREYGSQRAAEVHLFDTHTQKDILIDRGESPRWANKHNWLFYARFHSEDGLKQGKGTQVIWYDVSTSTKKRIAYGISYLKETDCNDSYLYAQRTPDNGRREAVRIPIRESAAPEVLPGSWGVGYNSLYVNPVHSVIVSRDHNYRDYYFSSEGTRDIPFVARHFFDHDLAGTNRTEPFPIMDGSHFAWSGDGAYFLAGNGPVRGRRWDEPLPANIHFLANTSVGDICPCGRSGRWLCGSTGGGRGPLRVADLRSGDGWIATKTFSFLCFPGSKDNSGPYDIDAKGSPDVTKIAFVSTYDLKDGPATETTEDFRRERIVVESTAGFPDKGRLVNPAGFGGEVIRYERKTSNSFEDITRGLYHTDANARLRSGQTLTSFDAMIIPEDKRKKGVLPPKSIRSIVADSDSPLLWQRSSDLYVAVVRLPDCPHFRVTDNGMQLIPGQNHWEIVGYDIYRGDEKITPTPIRPGAKLPVAKGTYTAVAVEWSGLRSQHCEPVKMPSDGTFSCLATIPPDFSWTCENYFVDDKEVDAATGQDAVSAVRKTFHLQEGLIRYEVLQNGELEQRFDLNPDEQATRKLEYHKGKISAHQYYDGQGELVSTEIFDDDEWIIESIRGRYHWWYEQGQPYKFENGSSTFAKTGERWQEVR